MDEIVEAKITLLDGKVADTKAAVQALSSEVKAISEDVRATVIERLQWIDARLDALELAVGEVRAKLSG